MEGDIDPVTGYVMDVQRIKQIATERLLRHLDHRNDLDVPVCRAEPSMT